MATGAFASARLGLAAVSLSPHQVSARRHWGRTHSSMPESPIQVGFIVASVVGGGCWFSSWVKAPSRAQASSNVKAGAAGGASRSSPKNSSGSSSHAACTGPGLLASPSVRAGLGRDVRRRRVSIGLKSVVLHAWVALWCAGRVRGWCDVRPDNRDRGRCPCPTLFVETQVGTIERVAVPRGEVENLREGLLGKR